jgi:UDP-N-acetylglucosamine 2-epimerase (non-hydrolysing)
MKKLKVVTIVGTRPEIIRLSRLIPKLDEYTDHIFVHTGQNSDPKLNDVFFDDLELRKPDYYLNVDTTSMGTVMGDVIKKSEEVFLKEKPDAVMILGDTNSAIAAIVAERLHIPVYHMEAGNRSFDNNVPEELNRKMVDHVASFNLPYNNYSEMNLLREGLHPRQIVKTGSPIPEIYQHCKNRIETSQILETLELKKGSFYLASIHRQENVDISYRLESIFSQLEELHSKTQLPVIVSTHPRTRKKLIALGWEGSLGVLLEEPFGYLDYNKLQLNAKCVISDSGTVFEESSIIGFNAVCLRDSSERPEAFAVGTALLSPVDARDLVSKVHHASTVARSEELADGYSVKNFSEIVLNYLLSTAKLNNRWKGILPHG